MRCERCFYQENLYMYFFIEKNKEIYLYAKCLDKIMLEDLPPQIYNMNQLVYI